MLALLPARGRAYSVQNHAALTERAASLIELCRREHGLATPAIDAQVAAVLTHYDVAQDALMRKPGLWHFPATSPPPTGDCPGPFPLCLLVIERSFERWVGALWQRVAQGASAEQLFPALGAVLHYVQDLAVPAHAVPIFHPPSWFQLTDPFDDYTGWQGASELAEDELAAACAKLSRPATLPEILKGARESTLDSLGDALVVEGAQGSVRRTFAWFWRLDPAHPEGFGRYGCQDFGESELDCQGAHYHVAEEAYRAYAARRARAAVVASAATIVLFQTKLAPCARKSCRPVVGDSRFYPTRAQLRALRTR